MDERLGRVYAVGWGYSSITTLDSRPGVQLCNSRLGPAGYSHVVGVAVDTRLGRVVVNTNDMRHGQGTVQILTARTGRVVHSAATDGGSRSTIAVDEATSRAFVLECPSGGYETEEIDITTCMVYVIDTRNGAVVTATHVDDARSMFAEDIVVDQRLGRAFVLTQGGDPQTMGAPYGTGRMAVFDTRSGHLLHRWQLGRGGAAEAVDVRSGRVFVANTRDATVSVYDIARL